ncbi:MAG: hypothetical protein HQL86_08850 [Magnetococcales bacterium]|nr:hypothetical protein [Magnetococcales bacterium]
MSMLDVFQQGGSMAVSTFLAFVIMAMKREIDRLKERLEALADGLGKYQIAHTQDHLNKQDINELKEMLRDHEKHMDEVVIKIFDRINDQQQKCGTNCLASRIERDCRQMHLASGGRG